MASSKKRSYLATCNWSEPETLICLSTAWKKTTILNKKDGYRQWNLRQFLQSAYGTFWPRWVPSVRPWDNRGKCHMDEKKIQCLSNASHHVSIYLQPFLGYSILLIENCNIFIPLPLFSGPQGVTLSEFREDRVYTQNWNEWVIVWWRKHGNMFSCFDTIPACEG